MKDQLIENIIDKIITFHNHIHLVNGYSNNLLVDTKNESYYKLNNETYNLLVLASGESVRISLDQLNSKDKNSFVEYLIQLESLNYIVISNPTGQFKNHIKVYNHQMLDHFLIDLRSFNKSSLAVFLKKSNKYKPNAYLFEVYDFFPDLNQIDAYIIIRIDYINFTTQKSFIDKNMKFIDEVHVYNSPTNIKNLNKVRFYPNQNLPFHCGVISKYWFTMSARSFNLSKLHNNCLHGKLSVDKEGNIKNCPSMSDSFGNIRDTTLAEVLEKPGFKKYWDIGKDKIHVCKDCEFRYICTDCRAYVENPEDLLSKPLKCGYNPYTGEWSEWSSNPLKQKAIEFYGRKNMISKVWQIPKIMYWS